MKVRTFPFLVKYQTVNLLKLSIKFTHRIIMNTKLLLATFLGIESAFLLPMASQAAIINSVSLVPAVKTELVSIKEASKPVLLAGYRKDYDRYDYNRDYYRNNNRRRIIQIEEPYRYRQPVRVQERFIVVPPARRYFRDNSYRNYNNYNNYSNYDNYNNYNNNSGEVFLRFGF